MIVRFLCVLACVTVCGAGSADAAEDGTIEIKPWHVPLKSSPNPGERADRAVYEAYLREHLNVRIKRATGLRIPGERGEASVLMSMAGETAPDIVHAYTRQVLNYANQGFYQPIDDLLADSPELKAKTPPQLWPTLQLDGKTYAVVYKYNTVGYCYRRDLFAAAGLDPDRPPETWDELYDYAQKLTSHERGQYGIHVSIGALAGHDWTSFVWQAGGNILERTEDGGWRATYNQEPAVVALTFLRKLVWGPWERDGRNYRGVAYQTSPAADVPALVDGKAAMVMMTVGHSNQLLSLVQGGLDISQIGYAPFPKGPAGYGSMMVGYCLGINAAVRNPEKRQACWDLIRFWASEEADRIRTESYIQAGWARIVQPNLLAKYGTADLVEQQPKNWRDSFARTIERARAMPYAPDYQTIQNHEMANCVQTALAKPDSDIPAILNESVDRVNRTLFGTGGVHETRWLRPVVAVCVVVFFLTFLIFFVLMLRLLSRRVEPSGGSAGSGPSRRMLAIAWIFMAPAILSTLIWDYYPFARGATMAFYDYRIAADSEWVGLSNFVTALTQPLFWTAMWNTLVYVAMVLGIGFFLPIFLALLLNEVPRLKMVFRTIYYLPAVTSPLVVMFLWKIFYDPTPTGFFNRILDLFGVPSQRWLADPQWAMLCIVITGVWAGTGPGSIIYLAALKSIPNELYEAADIDGAGPFRKILTVTFPMLKALVLINFVGAFIGAFHAAQNILVMTGGGPQNSTHVLGLEIFFDAFLLLKFGYATAIAWIMGSLLIGFTVYQLKILQSVKFTRAQKG